MHAIGDAILFFFALYGGISLCRDVEKITDARRRRKRS
jgi:hypothetical protein